MQVVGIIVKNAEVPMIRKEREKTTMKRNYATPVVEKIAFDYKAQIVTGSPECFQSVINVMGAGNTCVEGTPIVVGWTEPQTAV